jgi:hypothetical protein
MAPSTAIRIEPYPLGKRFALTFVDDTDYSTRANTEPVYDFLAAHGIWGAKTVWPLAATRPSVFRRDAERGPGQQGAGSTLEEPDYAAFIRTLKEQGFEIALHGMSAGNTRRSEVDEGLARFVGVVGEPPSINAFHRTNLENLYCGAHKLDSRLLRFVEQLTDKSAYEGHVPGTESFWGDVVLRTFRYVRLPFHTIDAIDTLRVSPSMPFRDPRRPFVREWFASSDGADVRRFNRLLAAPQIDRLEEAGGLCIVYTHFAKAFAVQSGTAVRLNQEFVAVVKDLARRSSGWFAKATVVLDRLAAVRAVSLTHRGGSVEVRSASDRPLEGLVLSLPAGLTLSDGRGALREAAPGLVVLPTLMPGATLSFSANRDGSQTIAGVPSVEISRREHRRIEYANYAGLVRGAWADRRDERRRRS